MKRQVFMILASLSLVVMSAYAQSSGTVIVANVPFDFIVSDKTLPAGEYTLTRPAQGITMIRSRDCKASVVFQTFTVESYKTRDELVFHRRGDKYFLSQVWTAGNSIGGELRKCRTEKNLQLEKISKAEGTPEFETVAVVARQR